MQSLGFLTKLIGQASEGIKNAAFSFLLLFLYSQVLGLPAFLAGTALAIALVFDAVTDPVAGSLSDSLKHRWGRRHPFMYASAIPLALSFALVFHPPSGLGQMGLFVWLTVFAVLVRGAMTLFHVPHLAWLWVRSSPMITGSEPLWSPTGLSSASSGLVSSSS
jgi:Na+/melibiose symporter-like transporter